MGKLRMCDVRARHNTSSLTLKLEDSICRSGQGVVAMHQIASDLILHLLSKISTRQDLNQVEIQQARQVAAAILAL